MDDPEKISNGIQKFDGINYAYWSDRVKTYLMALEVDIWYSIVNGYVIPNNVPTDPNEKKLMSCNSKARHVILAALAPTIASNLWVLALIKRYETNSRASMKVIQKLRRSSFNDIE
jgi:hypothetical protein